jgi:acyl carrier protein
MIDSEKLRSQIRSFIWEKFPIARKRGLNDELPLLETGIVDSLGVLDVVGFLEQTFQIRIDDDELTPDNFASIGSMAAFMERRIRPELSAK